MSFQLMMLLQFQTWQAMAACILWASQFVGHGHARVYLSKESGYTALAEGLTLP